MIQLQVLNYIIQAKSSDLIIINNLSHDFFSDYKAEFLFIKNHLDKYGNIPDAESFLSNFPSFEFIQVNEQPQYLIEELFKDRNERFLATTFNEVRRLLMNGDVNGAMSLYSKASEKLPTGVSLNSVDIFKDASRYNDYIDRMNDFSKFYVKTGFPELDKVIGGWDRQEDYVTITARPGVGKSWIILKCATEAYEQGLRVGLYSGEMSERMVGYRADTIISHISNGAMVHGNDSIQVEYKEYIEKMLKDNENYKGCFKVLTPAMINGPATVSSLRAFIEKDELDILFVDQHSLLEDERRAKNPVDRASNISKDIKNLQSLKKIPIITVSQQNRSKSEEGVDTSNIAQSDRIGQDSSIVLFIEKKDDIVKLTLAKSRFSAQGKTLSYQVDLNYGRFNYIPEEGDVIDAEGYESYENRYDVEIEGEEVF